MVIKNRQDILSNIKLLYNYKDSENMDLITAWNPDEDQWWICSFNPNVKYEDNRVENQVMIGSVDFSKHEEMYEAFVSELDNDNKKYVICDEENKIVWICWYEEDLVK